MATVYMNEDSSYYNLLPPKELEICNENLEEYFRAMFERQEVWVNRNILKKPRPWSNNQMFNDYKFTNVYRELDRSSQYLINNVIKKYKGWDNKDFNQRRNLLFQIVLYRYFNAPHTFEHIGFIPNYDQYLSKDMTMIKFGKLISEIRDREIKPFTAAYVINVAHASYLKSELLNNKVKYPKFGKKFSYRDSAYCYCIVPDMHKQITEILEVIDSIIADPESLNEVNGLKKGAVEIFNSLTSLPSIGDFMAHEIFIDLCYVEKYTGKPFFPFNEMSFTNVGPGASAGIRLIFPKMAETMPRKFMTDGIIQLQKLSKDYLNKMGFQFLKYDIETDQYYLDSNGEVSLHQIEMWLCEYQKYWRVKNGVGKQQSKFYPRLC